MILRFSAISDKFRNPERLTASENMKPFISSYTIQSHIFLINIKLSNMSKSSIKSSRAFSFDCNEEAVILNLVYFRIASTFGSTDPSSSTQIFSFLQYLKTELLGVLPLSLGILNNQTSTKRY